MTGASGVLGSQVTRLASQRGHVVRRLSRTARPGWIQGDVVTGAGLAAATTGVEAIIHCATNPRRHKATDRQGTAQLVAVQSDAGLPHIVYPGIVGSDVIPLGYYKSKTAAENTLEASGAPVTIQRYTQFHDLLWMVLSRLVRSPFAPVPNDTRFQVLDASVAARHLVDAAERPPAGRLPDVGGPTVYEVRELARSVAAALDRKTRTVRVNLPGLVGAAFRAGGNLTENRDESGRTWNDYVADRIS